MLIYDSVIRFRWITLYIIQNNLKVFSLIKIGQSSICFSSGYALNKLAIPHFRLNKISNIVLLTKRFHWFPMKILINCLKLFSIFYNNLEWHGIFLRFENWLLPDFFNVIVYRFWSNIYCVLQQRVTSTFALLISKYNEKNKLKKINVNEILNSSISYTETIVFFFG